MTAGGLTGEGALHEGAPRARPVRQYECTFVGHGALVARLVCLARLGVVGHGRL